MSKTVKIIIVVVVIALICTAIYLYKKSKKTVTKTVSVPATIVHPETGNNVVSSMVNGLEPDLVAANVTSTVSIAPGTINSVDTGGTFTGPPIIYAGDNSDSSVRSLLS